MTHLALAEEPGDRPATVWGEKVTDEGDSPPATESSSRRRPVSGVRGCDATVERPAAPCPRTHRDNDIAGAATFVFDEGRPTSRDPLMP